MATKRDDLDSIVETMSFLSDRNRLRIISLLSGGEVCVNDIMNTLGLPQPLVSYHLRKLRESGLVSNRRDRQWIFYSLDEDAWGKAAKPVAALFESPKKLLGQRKKAAKARR